jgi:hypothetical protein
LRRWPCALVVVLVISQVCDFVATVLSPPWVALILFRSLLLSALCHYFTRYAWSIPFIFRSAHIASLILGCPNIASLTRGVLDFGYRYAHSFIMTITDNSFIVPVDGLRSYCSSLSSYTLVWRALRSLRSSGIELPPSDDAFFTHSCYL